MDRVRRALRLDARAPEGSGVRVAVLDTGLDQDHLDFLGAVDVSTSVDCRFPPGDLRDDNGHGTHIAGIIGGRGTRSGGRYTGIAPGCELIVLRVADHLGFIDDTALLNGITEAIAAGADIINLSLSETPLDQTGRVLPPPWVWSVTSRVEKALERAAAEGILCVAAVGNEGPSRGTIGRPAGSGAVLAVGAVDPAGGIADFSGRAPYLIDREIRHDSARSWTGASDPAIESSRPKPDIVAPGVEIWAPLSGCLDDDALLQRCRADHRSFYGAYIGVGGTSQAAAVASGIAACALEYLRSRHAAPSPPRGAALQPILQAAARRLALGSPADHGCSTVTWPDIQAVIDQ